MTTLRFFMPVVALILSCFAEPVLASAKGSISLSQESFASPDYEQTGVKNYHYFGAGVKTRPRLKDQAPDLLQLDLQGQFSPDAPALSYLNPRETYVYFSNISLGRKKYNWSDLDETWHLGLYQPQFRFNALQPESQGLTGAFFRLDNESESFPLGLMVFGSGIYIPDQGPGYEIRDGKFVKSHPYFVTPPSKASVNGATDDINYTVDQPSLNSIVFNSSFALKVYAGHEDEDFYVQAAVAHKPSNQLALGVQGYVNPKNTLEATVLPAAWDHTLYSGDMHYSFQHASFGVGAAHETTEAPEYDQEWTYFRYTPSDLISPYLSLNFFGLKLTTSYLKITGGDSIVEGDLASSGNSILPTRYPYKEAYLFDASYDLKMKKRRHFMLGSRVVRGARGEFTLWTGSLNYQFDARWMVGASLQMISVSESTLGNRSYYSPYQNNDLIGLGVSYVF